MTLRVVIATRNPGKQRELRPLLEDAGLRPVTLTDLGIPEDRVEDDLEAFASFHDNAVAKARYFFARCGGAPVIADDSGLQVTALGGEPGVHSKRWSRRTDLTGQALDDANNAQLIARLRDASDRSARYVCVAAWADATGLRTGVGGCAGIIVDHPRGSGGFGYDPYFFSTELQKTFGEASLEEKARVSHRARAVRELLRQPRP